MITVEGHMTSRIADLTHEPGPTWIPSSTPPASIKALCQLLLISSSAITTSTVGEIGGASSIATATSRKGSFDGNISTSNRKI